jgi:3-oxoacyl-[acyl-carrier protein] reductase
MTLNLEGKVALVTGAGRGIGRAISVALGQAGATVVAAARTTEQIEAVAGEITDAGGKAVAIAADVAEESDISSLFDQVRERFGRLDVLVNNAGVGVFGPVAELSPADFDQVVAVNLRGVFLCCQQAMRMMIPQGSGYIINISSVVGFRGYPNQSAYTAAKHGVMGLTKSLAVEAQKHGIRVSAVLPGGVSTDLIRAARPDLDPSVLMQPEDIAQTVMYLLSLSDNAAVDQIYIRRRTSQPF